MQVADFPFGYMYCVRLRTPARAVRFVMAEWLPVALALWVVHLANFWLIMLMLAGNFAIYEIGYFVNDLADSSGDPNGDHLKGRRIDSRIFFGSHTVFAALVATVLSAVKGTHFAICYSSLAAIVLLLFFWHTSRRPRGLRFLRIFTFTTLSMYKFVPVVIPLLSLADAQLVLFALFFCWGFWRVLSYTLIKFGENELTSQGQNYDPCRLFHLFSLILYAPLVVFIRSNGPASEAALVIWAAHTSLALLRTAHELNFLKRIRSVVSGVRAKALVSQGSAS